MANPPSPAVAYARMVLGWADDAMRREYPDAIALATPQILAFVGKLLHQKGYQASVCTKSACMTASVLDDGFQTKEYPFEAVALVIEKKHICALRLANTWNKAGYLIACGVKFQKGCKVMHSWCWAQDQFGATVKAKELASCQAILEHRVPKFPPHPLADRVIAHMEAQLLAQSVPGVHTQSRSASRRI